MNTYEIEITDTFGGEANYCWVKRYDVSAKSVLGAVRKVANTEGYKLRKEWGDSEFSRYNVKGACICVFVTFKDKPL